MVIWFENLRSKSPLKVTPKIFEVVYRRTMVCIVLVFIPGWKNRVIKVCYFMNLLCTYLLLYYFINLAGFFGKAFSFAIAVVFIGLTFKLRSLQREFYSLMV